VFRYALRRALWAIPTLIGVSLVVFLMTTLLPDPLAPYPTGGSSASSIDPATFDKLTEERRSRFLDLPRFVNTDPRDVRILTDEYVGHIVADDDDAKVSARRLAALGGAALPHLLPRFDNLPAAGRKRVALALVPVARRMRRFDEGAFETEGDATLFWSRFWDDHSIDFTEPAAKRAVDRLVEHGGEEREQDLYLLDTFALPYVMAAMGRTDRRDALAQLARVAAHATERDGSIPDDAPATTVRARQADWGAWWFVHESDFVPFTGAERVAASVSQTRYAKWMLGAILGQLTSGSGEELSLGDRLKRRGLLTLSLTFLAMLLSYGLAVPLGVISAYRKNRPIDRVLALGLFVVYALPSFVLGEICVNVFGLGHAAFFAVLTLAAGSVATLSRFQRAAVLEVLGSDYVRAARAKGVFGVRLLVVHALRNALMPMVTLAGVQIPTLIGGAFVVEEVFSLRGMGWETLRAIERHDSAWIVVAVLATALLATFTLLASDVVHGLLDPRVRETLRRRGA
jgi:peptide/nickel transport system permease protein